MKHTIHRKHISSDKEFDTLERLAAAGKVRCIVQVSRRVVPKDKDGKTHLAPNEPGEYQWIGTEIGT